MIEVVEQHFKNGKPSTRLMYTDPVSGKLIPHLKDIPFFALQHTRVLHNKGLIDPEQIDDYIWRGGYTALYKALFEMTPQQIISEVKESNIRERWSGISHRPQMGVLRQLKK